MEALHHQILTDAGFRNHQIIDVQVMVVFGIGDGRLQRLLDDAGDALLRKSQNIQGAFDLLAADLLRHQVQLARGDADVAGNGHRLMVRQYARASLLAH